MKNILNQITKALEDTTATLGALELALINSGYITDKAVDLNLAEPRMLAQQQLAKIRGLIASLPEE
jgi:hypothetical protein